jgi:hypothetical protein
MADSVHTARYITMLSDAGWDIHLFPVYYCEPHENFRNVTTWNFATSHRPSHVDKSVVIKGIWPIRIGSILGTTATRVAARFGFDTAWLLGWLIRKLQPDVVHSLELQLAGYLVDDVKRNYRGRFPTWIALNRESEKRK